MFQDFELRLEYMLRTPSSDGSVTLKAWPDAGGKRYDLPLSRMTFGSPDALLTTASGPPPLLRSVEVKSSGPRTWRSVLLRRHGNELEIRLDESLAAAYEVEPSPMTIAFWKWKRSF
jgi:hypothetical protein